VECEKSSIFAATNSYCDGTDKATQMHRMGLRLHLLSAGGMLRRQAPGDAVAAGETGQRMDFTAAP